ncbi:uncharacterized protein LOC124175599 [Neodiprion fabricii]|uniref:uncharacterized protein LOC124175599 n=1 Tax=Neodiprion fabricii TaxID=2872261 RepID=UPI001ED97271|nr:uncharacterized protein LOC124175599 [Neodiprion fabricii]
MEAHLNNLGSGSWNLTVRTRREFHSRARCYLDTKALLFSWLLEKPPSPAPAVMTQAMPAPTDSLTGKLPKLEIPHFFGELREWETFRDLFTAMVHNHRGLSPAVKLQYLKISVTEEVAQLLQNIAVSDANDEDAWQLLIDRYDNPRILVQGHAARPATTASSHNNSSPSLGSKPHKSNVSSHTVSNTLNDNANKKGRKCPLCSESHFIGACTQYKNECPSTKKCLVCGKSHHTSLHATDHSSVSAAEGASPSPDKNSSAGSAASTLVQANHVSKVLPYTKTVLLGTALVTLISESRRQVPAHILIHPGSEGCFISEAATQALQVTRTPVSTPISGVAGAKAGVSKGVISVVVSSRVDPSVQISVAAYVLTRVTRSLPSRAAPKVRSDHVIDLTLADPEFDKPRKIDMLLGADVYRELLLRSNRFGPPGTPVAQETIFGWILTGPTSTNPALSNKASSRVRAHHCSTESDLSELVRKFWELDELPTKEHVTEEEEKCESLFRGTTRRDETGRYVVRLPFGKDLVSCLGESHAFACRALVRSERRRESEPQLGAEYSRFLSEYLSLGHMELAPVANAGACAPRYYMHHHAVVREVQGPKLQTDISAILTRWRRHRVVFAADIVKMFRQIHVAPEDCDLQRIVWRECPESPVQDFRLLTVTYGTACASYLAIRTLQRLAEDEAQQFPTAVHARRHDTYVNDTLTGTGDLTSARELMKSLTNLLKSGGFEVGKWMSNHPELLVGIGNCEASSPSARKFEPNEWVGTLGVVWTPSDDSFRVKLNLDLNHTTASKRSLLSELARIFDPLGWLAPVLVYVKIFFQDTWISGATWDDPLHAETLSPWLHLRSTLPRLEDLVIPRWLGLTTHPRRYQLHGFSDASERPYTPAVYVRVCSEDDSYTVSLLCSKTKVAPVESNRVAEIQTLLPNTTWQHVKSAENPADLATRSITPEQILQADLWWQGPSWLKGPQSEWPQRKLASVDITGLDTHIEPIVHATCIAEDNEILSRFSFLKRLLRVTAWCLRCRNGIPADHHVALGDLQLLSASEIAAARERWIIITQRVAFPDEIAALQNKKLLPSRSALTRLNPFLDDGGVLRLGGRLQCAVLSYQERHPAILLGSSRFTDLFIRHAHDITLHGGAQLTVSHLLRHCWILGGRNKVRSLVRRCIECTRHRAPIPQQQMGQLPTARVNKLSRPFEKAGLDYAGPFLLRASSGRGRTTFKDYIALFVCLATRAIHLEVVGSYTTASFLAVFKRFTARHGIYSELHSDNGTNFRGADQEL